MSTRRDRDTHFDSGQLAGASREVRPDLGSNALPSSKLVGRLGPISAFAGALFAMLGHLGPAYASSCGDPAAPVILDDSFADPHNGWPKDATAKFSPDGLTLVLNPKFDSYFYTNPTVQAHDADYCLQAVMPMDLGDKKLTAVGLLFLYENSKNYWTLELFGDGYAQIEHLVDGKRIVPYSKVAPGDPKPDDIVALRARVKNGQIRFSIDGTEVALLKAELPVGDLSFGAYVHKDQPPAPALAFTFDRMVVGGLP